MPKIKISFPSNDHHFEKQTPGFSACWGEYQFFINQEVNDCDVWVVCENLYLPEESTNCPPSNTLLITGEPYSVWHYDKKFLKQFSHVLTSQREIKGSGVIYFIQGHGWHLGQSYNFSSPNNFSSPKSYDELVNMKVVPKTKLLSIITSNKQYTVGHRQRYKFALAMKEALGDQVDLFGRGINDFNDKWDVLAPYKYSVAIENCATDDYISEKLNDCFLAHTFPFYYGAPNVGSYFSSEAYELININDLAGSIKKIKSIINDPNHYQKHLNAVIEAKLKYLNNYNLFPLIVELVKDWPTDTIKEKIILKKMDNNLSWDNKFRIISDKLKMFCNI